MQIVLTGRGYKVVVLPREELQPARLWRERSEGYREEHQLVRLIAYRYDPWIRIRYSTRIVLFFTYVVYYILFRIFLKRPRGVNWTYYIHLVVFELSVAFIEIEYVICIVYSEYAVCGIPMNVEGFCIVPHHTLDEEYEDENGPRRLPEAEISERHHSACLTQLSLSDRKCVPFDTTGVNDPDATHTHTNP